MTEVSEFLVELGTEELPPKSLLSLSTAFGKNVEDLLTENSLTFESLNAYATPRRLALRVHRLAMMQPDRPFERRGPPTRIAVADDGSATKAGKKFAQSQGVAFDALERLDTDKGEYLLYRGVDTGSPATDILPTIIEKALAALPIARRMRWGDSDYEFVRPVHWVVMLLDEDIISATLFGKQTDRITHGHRFLAPGELSIQRADDYPKILFDSGYVIADFERRKKKIEDMTKVLASEAGGDAIYDDALLSEVTSLVEWPVPVAGEFEPRFLDLPREVLISTLQSHQRYFPLQTKDPGDSGRSLLPGFIAISNIESREPERVRHGNERVIRPRLDDAAFFWGQDRKRSLESRRVELDGIIFQHKLGSLLDKSKRVGVLVRSVARKIGVGETDASRAATLAKCDLVTDMVGEFPDLQGTMGRYYALNDGESIDTALAIEEQYLPRYAGDGLPSQPAGQALAIAEKIDTLVSIFGIGQRPSGTRDPFGLRRGALGVLRIMIECELDLDLSGLITEAAGQVPGVDNPEQLAREVFDYMMDRLRAYYTDGTASSQASVDVFEAVLARQPVSPLDFHRRVEAVLEFARLPAAESLAAANKRVANILDKAESSSWNDADPARMTEAEEKALYNQLAQLRVEVEPLLERRE